MEFTELVEVVLRTEPLPSLAQNATATTFDAYGGDAVYIARAMLNLVLDDFLPDDQRREDDGAAPGPFAFGTFYPNPASTDATYRLWKMKEHARYRVVLSDPLGQTVSTATLGGATDKVSFNTSSSSDGLYILDCYEDRKPVDKKKLVISKR